MPANEIIKNIWNVLIFLTVTTYHEPKVQLQLCPDFSGCVMLPVTQSTIWTHGGMLWAYEGLRSMLFRGAVPVCPGSHRVYRSRWNRKKEGTLYKQERELSDYWTMCWVGGSKLEVGLGDVVRVALRNWNNKKMFWIKNTFIIIIWNFNLF